MIRPKIETKKQKKTRTHKSDTYICFSNEDEEIMAEAVKMSEKNWAVLDPESFGGTDYSEWGPIATPEQEQAIKELYEKVPELNNKKEAWIQTYTGKKFFPLDPRIEDICIEDIAHALAMQCRFTGHCKSFYSVGQHSVLVSYLCNEKDRKHGLLHDASEAYISDLSAPLKRSGRFEEYKAMEKDLQHAIFYKFGLDKAEPPSVKTADLLMLGIEAQTLLEPKHPDWKYPIAPPPFTVISLSPEQAKTLFLRRFNELFDIK